MNNDLIGIIPVIQVVLSAYMAFQLAVLLCGSVVGILSVKQRKKRASRKARSATDPTADHFHNKDKETRHAESFSCREAKTAAGDSGPKISILIPAWDEEAVILNTLSAVLHLNYRNYEVIVIDDGSTDRTSAAVIDAFSMRELSPRPIEYQAKGKVTAIYRTTVSRPFAEPGADVELTLIRKENGGKSDALNVGIYHAQYPYFVSLDADSAPARNALAELASVLICEETLPNGSVRVGCRSDIVAAGGRIRVMRDENGRALLPRCLLRIQQYEYDRTFLTTRILSDRLGIFIMISGAFGLFRKDVVMIAGNYATDTLGEDLELVLRILALCNGQAIYVPRAVCETQAPDNIRDLFRQRRRWQKGLIQAERIRRGMTRTNLTSTIPAAIRHENPRTPMPSHKVPDGHYRITRSAVTLIYFYAYGIVSPVMALIGIIQSFLVLSVGMNIFLLWIPLLIVQLIGEAALSCLIYLIDKRIRPVAETDVCLYGNTEHLTVHDLILRLFVLPIYSILLIGVALQANMTVKRRGKGWGKPKRRSADP